MHYNAMKKVLALVLGGVITLSTVACGTASLEPHVVGHITRDQWQRHRAEHPNEDEPGWDCRLDGNMICGGRDKAAYSLSCTQYNVTSELCALERHPIGG